MGPALFEHPRFEGYALLDSGGGEKLERFGSTTLVRPDPQALWRPRLPAERWDAADLRFVRESDRGGRWEGPAARGREPEWSVSVRGSSLLLRATPFKHVGLFPEQAANWELVERLAEALPGPRARSTAEAPRLLNLFGYTGAASVFAARAGFAVTHVDASKASLAWARRNAGEAGLEERAVRFLLEDASAFARREVRRGSRYDALLVDPPHYGRGPKGEKWRLEDGLGPLVDACGALLSERGVVVLSTYAVGFSPLSLENLLASVARPGDELEAGELALPEAPDPEEGLPPRRLPCGFCARLVRGLSGV